MEPDQSFSGELCTLQLKVLHFIGLNASLLGINHLLFFDDIISFSDDESINKTTDEQTVKSINDVPYDFYMLLSAVCFSIMAYILK